MAPRHLRLSLLVLQLATLATLVRSVALDRWITVFASVVLLGATYAAGRGRTWGIALAMTIGVTFMGLWAEDVGSAWFALVGLLAVRPFVRLFRHFARFDRGAAVMLAGIASTLGALGALAWREYAHALFRALPFLTPSLYPHHLPAIFGALGVGAIASRLVAGKHAEESAQASSGERFRIAEPETAIANEEELARQELEDALDPMPTAKAHRVPHE